MGKNIVFWCFQGEAKITLRTVSLGTSISLNNPLTVCYLKSELISYFPVRYQIKIAKALKLHYLVLDFGEIFQLKFLISYL